MDKSDKKGSNDRTFRFLLVTNQGTFIVGILSSICASFLLVYSILHRFDSTQSQSIHLRLFSSTLKPFCLMKFSSFALHTEPQYDHDHKRYFPPSPSASSRQHHWVTTIMDNTTSQESAASHGASHKASLAYILHEVPDVHGNATGSETESDHELTVPLPAIAMAKRRRVSPKGGPTDQSTTKRPAFPTSPDANKKGSKFCVVDGCTSRAKHARKCWRHGGSVKCKVVDCINRAKSKGVCWSHGGGTICSHDECETIAVSHGYCWAHGGGKRCQIHGCSRPAYERTGNHCTTHHKQRVRAAATSSMRP
jgi:hypothetical protein